MVKSLKKNLSFIYNYLSKQTVEASQQIILFAIVMIINFPLFGVVAYFQNTLSNEELILRAVSTCFCLLLITNRFWPTSMVKFLPFVWYVTLLLSLPFFFAYLTVLHNGSTIWLMKCVPAVFFLFLVTRVLDSLILLVLGVGLALISYIYGAQHVLEYIPGEMSFPSFVTTFIAALVIGSLFARDREIIQAGRITSMRLLAGSLAHDLRTSLASIHLQAELQEVIVEKLSNSDVQMDLKKSLNKIIRGIEMGNQLISMQLNNIQHEKFATDQFSIQSIQTLLKKNLEEYPLKEELKSLIKANLNNDFLVWIEAVAFKNLIWNLLKNSLDYIEETGKGDITIWLTCGEDGDNFNYLNIKDTAKGIYPKHAEKIFESFYSDRKGGTGVGLAYCKLLMKAAGGDIYCEGKFNKYAHFILKFPKID